MKGCDSRIWMPVPATQYSPGGTKTVHPGTPLQAPMAALNAAVSSVAQLTALLVTAFESDFERTAREPLPLTMLMVAMRTEGPGGGDATSLPPPLPELAGRLSWL